MRARMAPGPIAPVLASYEMAGKGATSIQISGGSVTASQSRRGYPSQTIPLENVAGFFLEVLNTNLMRSSTRAMLTFDADFVLAFDEKGKRRVYRLAVNSKDPAFQELLLCLREQRPTADRTHLTPGDAAKELGISSGSREVLILVGILMAAFALIAAGIAWVVRASR